MSANRNLLANTITDLQTGNTKTVEDLFLSSGYTSVGSFVDETVQAGLSDTPSNS